VSSAIETRDGMRITGSFQNFEPGKPFVAVLHRITDNTDLQARKARRLSAANTDVLLVEFR
jgi:hypothetical protein